MMRKDTFHFILKLFGSLLLVVIPASGLAESFITDKINARIYEAPFAESTVLRTLSTGTPVETLQQQENFSRIRTADGKEGWVETIYISESKPAQLLLPGMTGRQKQLETELADARKQILDMQERLASQGSATQVNSAELDNLKSTNRSLRNQLGEMEKALDESRQSLKTTGDELQATIAQREALEKEIAVLRELPVTGQAGEQPASAVTETDKALLAELQATNATMKKQLDTVYTALSVPAPDYVTASDTGNESTGTSIHTGWLITWLLLMLLAGVGIGWQWFERMHMKRHGGFRL